MVRGDTQDLNHETGRTAGKIDPRIDALGRYLFDADPEMTREQFWNGWRIIAGSLASEVWSDAASPELRESFTELLEAADDAGWQVPDDQTQQGEP